MYAVESKEERSDVSGVSQLTWPWEVTAFSLATHIVLAKTSSAVTLDSYRQFIHQLLIEHNISASLVLVTLLRHLVPIPSLTSTERIAIVSAVSHYVVLPRLPFFLFLYAPITHTQDPTLLYSLSPAPTFRCTLGALYCRAQRVQTRTHVFFFVTHMCVCACVCVGLFITRRVKSASEFGGGCLCTR
jgi:hypothetical protein